MTSRFNMLDTTRADGVYVTFERIESHDDTASPHDYLFQEEDYREEDEARLQAWRDDEWHFVGIQARASVIIVRNGTGTIYTLTSPGLWGIESDSGEDYLSEVFNEECVTLRGDIEALAAMPVAFETPAAA